MPTFGGSWGWRRQNPDARDLLHTPERVSVPSSVDMRGQCPPIWDQGSYGSCTSHAACAAFEFDVLKQGLTDFMPSRMFEYYNTRLLDGDVHTDGGGTIRHANKALAKYGVCAETRWPYTHYDLLHTPTKSDYKAALPNRITQYMAVNQSLLDMQATLASGLPIQIGFTVYESFESDAVATTGIVPMPDLAHESVLGGHAVLICGFAPSMTVAGQALTDVFLCRNSWGTSWGMVQEGWGGYFTMPYAYLTNPNLAGDLWVIQTVP